MYSILKERIGVFMRTIEEELIRLFQSGERPSAPMRLGLELEHFALSAVNGRRLYYDDGVRALLEDVAWQFETCTRFLDGGVSGLFGKDFSLTLEPSAQLEVSIRPVSSVEEIRQLYDRFASMLAQPLQKRGVRLVTFGVSPASLASECVLIDKMRYVMMDRYFRSLGKAPVFMMRQTASTQVSIDYQNEQDFVDKLRLASALSPLIYLMTENAPVVEGAPVRGHCPRIWAWRHVDDARTGTLPCVFDDDFGYKRLAQFYAALPPIFAASPDGHEIYTGSRPAAEVFDPAAPDDARHLLSMAFFDVRVKPFIEIRMADSMPVDLACAYAALIKGIFGDEANVRNWLDRLGCQSAQAVEDVKTDVMENGWNASLYGKDMGETADALFASAARFLPPEEQALLLPLQRRVQARLRLFEPCEEDSHEEV